MSTIASPRRPGPNPFHAALHHDPESARLALEAMEDRRAAELARAERRHGRYHLAGRFLVAAMLLTSAVVKVLTFRTTADWMSELGFLDSGFPLAFAVAFEAGAGLMIALGWWTRRVAGVMLAYFAAVSLVLLTYFPMALALGATLSNVGLAAGLLLLLAHGAGTSSVDGRREAKARE